MIRAHDDRKLIVCDIWLDYCFYFYTYINVDDFILNKENDKLNKEIYSLNFKYILEKNRENINKFYSSDNENIDSFLKKFT